MRFTILARLLALLGLLGLTACTTLQEVFITEEGVVVTQGLSYGPQARHKIDLYRPAKGEARATLIYVYGGSWKSGNRELYRFLGLSFAKRGIAVAVIDYRLHPEVVFPAFVEDAARAVAWVRSEGPANGLSGPLFLMGHSAGAHTVALLSLDPTYLNAFDMNPSEITGTIALAGPHSFNPLEFDSTRPIFESMPDIDRARPIKLVRKEAPPILLLHGEDDKTVGVHNSRNLATALEAAGAPVELKTYRGLGHLMIVGAIAWPLRWQAPVLADSLDFIDRKLATR